MFTSVTTKKTKVDLSQVSTSELGRELARRRTKIGIASAEDLSRAGRASGRARRLKAQLAKRKA